MSYQTETASNEPYILSSFLWRRDLFERRKEISKGSEGNFVIIYLFIPLSNPIIDNNFYFMTPMFDGLRLDYLNQHFGGEMPLEKYVNRKKNMRV